MDAIAREKLEALVASLPTEEHRERLAEAFARSSTPASVRQTPQTHAAAVVSILEAQQTDLRGVLQFLAEHHPPLQDRIDQVATLSLPRTQRDEEDEPTEMIDPALLATLRTAGTPQLGNRKTLPPRAPASRPAGASPAAAPDRAAAAGPARPPKLPRGGGTPAPRRRKQLSPSALAGAIVALLVAAAVVGFAALQ